MYDEKESHQLKIGIKKSSFRLENVRSSNITLQNVTTGDVRVSTASAARAKPNNLKDFLLIDFRPH